MSLFDCPNYYDFTQNDDEEETDEIWRFFEISHIDKNCGIEKKFGKKLPEKIAIPPIRP